jgi:hypothetical protein
MSNELEPRTYTAPAASRFNPCYACGAQPEVTDYRFWEMGSDEEYFSCTCANPDCEGDMPNEAEDADIASLRTEWNRTQAWNASHR